MEAGDRGEKKKKKKKKTRISLSVMGTARADTRPEAQKTPRKLDERWSAR
jgi:hypothetical protein